MSNTAHTLTRGVVLEFGLGDRLRKARTYAGFEREDFAQRLGVTAKTVYNYEQPDWPVKRQTVLAWAFATGVDFDWLWTGTAPEGPGMEASSGFAWNCDAQIIKFPSRIAA